MESSRRDLFTNMVIDKFIFKYNQVKLSPVSPSYLKQLHDNLK